MAAVSVANIVKTSLGPVGLDKMLVDDVGVSFFSTVCTGTSCLNVRFMFFNQGEERASPNPLFQIVCPLRLLGFTTIDSGQYLNIPLYPLVTFLAQVSLLPAPNNDVHLFYTRNVCVSL